MVIFRFQVSMMFLGTKKGIDKAFGIKKWSSIKGLKKRNVAHGLYKLCDHPVRMEKAMDRFVVNTA